MDLSAGDGPVVRQQAVNMGFWKDLGLVIDPQAGRRVVVFLLHRIPFGLQFTGGPWQISAGRDAVWR
jgi:hypothetical protein